MTMIIGAHSIIYSRKPEADREFLRDVMGLSHVDIGEGWLIFGLPPAELAIHPSTKNNIHELYFMCKDIQVFMAAMGKKNVACDPIQSLSWGNSPGSSSPAAEKLGCISLYINGPKRLKKPRRKVLAEQQEKLLRLAAKNAGCNLQKYRPGP